MWIGSLTMRPTPLPIRTATSAASPTARPVANEKTPASTAPATTSFVRGRRSPQWPIGMAARRMTEMLRMTTVAKALSVRWKAFWISGARVAKAAVSNSSKK